MLGYRIVYSKDKPRFHKQTKILLIIIAVSAVLLAISHFTGSIQLPETALENMVDAVQSGDSLTDAITAFCREIIADAQIYY